MTFDVGIIGGGPGGYSAAFEAAKNGLSVILFESERLGGTCLNRGCIPTKYMAHFARMRSDACSLHSVGICEDVFRVDFPRLHQDRERTIDVLRENLWGSLMRDKVKVVRGFASIDEPGLILCSNEKYSVKNIIIATGATVKKPLADGFLNSDGVLRLTELPRKVKIVGGGTVAVEFAQMLRRLGSEVTVQIRGDRLLRAWNREASVSITQILKADGIIIKTKCEKDILENRDADICISALGVEPSLSGLNKELFDIGELGGIVVDSCGRTKTSGIYAVGDVTEKSSFLAHHAMEEGKRAVQDILGNDIPKRAAKVKCIYLSPEIAEAGIMEDVARESGILYESVKVPLYSNPMNMIYGGKRGYIQVVADKDKGTLIGAQIFGERASDLISELCLAINAEIPVWKCAGSVRPHPSFSEGITEAFTALCEKLR